MSFSTPHTTPLEIQHHDGPLTISGRTDVLGTVRGRVTVLSGSLIVHGTIDGDVDIEGGRVVVLGRVTGRVANAAGSVEIAGEVGSLTGPPAYATISPTAVVDGQTGSEKLNADRAVWTEALDNCVPVDTGETPVIDLTDRPAAAADLGIDRAPVGAEATIVVEPQPPSRPVAGARDASSQPMVAMPAPTADTVATLSRRVDLSQRERYTKAILGSCLVIGFILAVVITASVITAAVVNTGLFD